MRALIYTRVSDDQRNGRSPAEQEAETRELCEREGWEVVEVLTDSAGASRHSRKARPGWERAKGLIAAEQIDVLVTWEASRAERKLTGVAELIELCAAHGVLISYKGRTYDPTHSRDRYYLGQDGVAAVLEADVTSERVLRAMRENAAEGRPHGRLPYGYRREYEPAGKSRQPTLVRQYPDPDTAPVVRRIFTEYLSGRGARSIATDLNRDGIKPPRKSRAWDEQMVRRILRNPAYCGRRTHHGELSDVTWDGWEPIMDIDTYERAVARLDRMGERNVRQSSRAHHLLTGVARCGVCGSGMRALPRPNRMTYACRGEHACVGRSLDKLDLYVTGKVLERLSRRDVADALADTPNPEAEAARATAAELRAELDEAFSLWQAKELSVGAYSRMEMDLKVRIAEADKVARRAVVPLDVDVPDSGLDEWWDDLDDERRREIVAALLTAVVVRPLKPGMDRRRFHAELVTLDWR